MTQARHTQISLADTTYYHCVNRCVRRAFLCGVDRESGQNYEHRRQWIVDKIKELSSVFGIDVCAYAVMANHYHVALHVDRKRTLAWDESEVARRWKLLFKGTLLVDRYTKGECVRQAEEDKAREAIESWRERLADISWYMRCLNEFVAREANREDGCKGRFWEGRFKSQALLDERGLLACMAYVDLNPIRAGLCETPEASDFTSIQERIREFVDRKDTQGLGDDGGVSGANPIHVRPSLSTLSEDAHSTTIPAAPLARFFQSATDKESALPFTFSDYLDLVDWTGRAVRVDKRGAIPPNVPPILRRLGIEPESWIETVQYFRRHFFDYVGPADALERCSRVLDRKWLRGVGACRKLLGGGECSPVLAN
jgi:REP element-mobilizing transposase RayT